MIELTVVMDELRATSLFQYKGTMRLIDVAITNVNEPLWMNKSELADRCEISHPTLNQHIDTVVDLGIYEKRGEPIARYRPDENSVVLSALIELEVAIQSVESEQ